MASRLQASAIPVLMLLAGLAAPPGASSADRAHAPATFREALGARFRPTPDHPSLPRRRLERRAALEQWYSQWHAIAIDTTGLDHAPVAAGDTRRFGEQLGPGRSSRAMAIVHVAMFEAINATVPRRYPSKVGLAPARGAVSLKAAIARSAHDTLVALYASHAARLDAQFAEDLATLPQSAEKDAGLALGARAARAVLASRADDGSATAEPVMDVGYHPEESPGVWRQDPVSRIPLALGARWSEVRPFAIASADAHRLAPPPALGSDAYARAFDEVQRLGGDGVNTSTERTAEQTEIGLFWAYDGTPSLCAPPRLYNQVAERIAEQRRLDLVAKARLLARVNVALADAGLAAWESKYHYAYWRPVTAIREADAGTGPSGQGDGNAATTGDPGFTPLGAPASNLEGPNFTPPFPSYPSGHAVFGAALFESLRLVLGTDRVPFEFVSDEMNGVTAGADGVVRPRVLRRYRSLSQAEAENGRSRVYLGIHWSFDVDAGITQGRAVARDVARLWYPARPD